jgi:signal transduction histidine kinase
MVHEALTIAVPIIGILALISFLPVLFFSKLVFRNYNQLYKPFFLALLSMFLLNLAYLAHSSEYIKAYKVLELFSMLGTITATWLILRRTASVYILSQVNKRLEVEVESKTQELEGLLKIASAMHFSQTKDEILENITKIIAEAVGAKSAVITLYDKEEGLLKAQNPGYNVPKDLIDEWVVELRGDKPAVEIFKNKSYYISNDTYTDSKLDNSFMRKYGLKNTINVSFSSPEGVVGNLGVFNKEGGFSEDDAQLLSQMGPQLAATVENTVLENKMRESHKMLKHAYEQLSEVDRLKNDIMSNVSHELRTPITVIRGSLDIIGDSNDLEEIREFSKRAQQQLTHQLGIIANLLCFSETAGEEPKRLFKKFTLKELVEDIIVELEPYRERKKVNFELHLPKVVTLFADEDMIKRALKNIIDNSIKFNQTEGKISIKSYKENGNIKIEIIDTGIGIPPQHMKNVFLPLFQGDPTSTREYGGTGMGLAAAKKCVEFHGGSIKAENNNGHGTCFTVRIPTK